MNDWGCTLCGRLCLDAQKRQLHVRAAALSACGWWCSRCTGCARVEREQRQIIIHHAGWLATAPVLYCLPPLSSSCCTPRPLQAHPCVLLVHPLLCHHEAANHAHDQVPICALLIWEEGELAQIFCCLCWNALCSSPRLCVNAALWLGDLWRDGTRLVLHACMCACTKDASRAMLLAPLLPSYQQATRDSHPLAYACRATAARTAAARRQRATSDLRGVQPPAQLAAAILCTVPCFRFARPTRCRCSCSHVPRCLPACPCPLLL